MAVNLVQSYPKGAVLFSLGDKASIVHVVLEGTIIASKDGQQVALGAGGILGDVAFFSEGTYTYHAICATDVTTLAITKANGSQVMSSQPRIALSLLTELALKAKGDELVFFQGVEQKTESAKDLGALPPGHPILHDRVSVEHREFLFSTDVECPICETHFTGTRIRTSRLQLEDQKGDLRTIYRNFEPNFYYIWVCPNCQFAYPERQYTKLSRTAITRGRNAWKENPASESFEFEVPRTIQQVITSYYLSMATFEKVGATPDQWANLWLRLVWIYEDLGLDELALKAAAKAKAYFSESMSTTARSSAGDQQLYLLLAELDLRLENKGDAFKNLHAAATMIGGDPRYKRMAADRILDLRERRES